jgi:hypothetical protein
VTVSQRTGEMIGAARRRDIRAFETAYQLRGSELGSWTFRWVPALWFKTMKVAVILALAWSIGIVLHLPRPANCPTDNVCRCAMRRHACARSGDRRFLHDVVVPRLTPNPRRWTRAVSTEGA